MPTPDEKEINDPASRKLPPINREPESNQTSGGFLPTAGVSTKLKVFVIGLTFVTISAFGIFLAMFAKKVFIKGEDNVTWGPQLVTIAEQLNDKGLKPQAIEHYKRYLETQEVDLKTRSSISFNIATLYVELGQCDDAVVWFLHANTAKLVKLQILESENQLQQCRDRSKAPR